MVRLPHHTGVRGKVAVDRPDSGEHHEGLPQVHPYEPPVLLSKCRHPRYPQRFQIDRQVKLAVFLELGKTDSRYRAGYGWEHPRIPTQDQTAPADRHQKLVLQAATGYSVSSPEPTCSRKADLRVHLHQLQQR